MVGGEEKHTRNQSSRESGQDASQTEQSPQLVSFVGHTQTLRMCISQTSILEIADVDEAGVKESLVVGAEEKHTRRQLRAAAKQFPDWPGQQLVDMMRSRTHKVHAPHHLNRPPEA